MEIKEIVGRNYYATKRRGQISPSTTNIDFLVKIEEELEELTESCEGNKLDKTELADIVLVCFAMARYNKIDLLKVMEEKMKYNEKRIDIKK